MATRPLLPGCCSPVDDLRWFAPNAYSSLIVPELRRQGLKIAMEGTAPARLVFAAGARVADVAWRFSRATRSPLILYIWDLPPRATGSGRPDPVWWLAGHFLRLPRPFGGYGRRRGYFSRLNYIAARADAVWVASTLTRELMAERFGVAAELVPYCYDSERFRSAGAAPSRPPTLLCVSRLQPHKNQAAVLRAASRFRRDVRVRLIGRGPESQTLANAAAALGVHCDIETDASDATVTEAYHSAGVVVCPSRFEGFGLTPIEGVASGAPVVASDIPPHREFVGSAAKFFELEDDEALVGAINAALDGGPADPELVRGLTIPAAGERFRSSLGPYLR
jgi:glycosyltransferase involved in cell wall biosynthesis